jgi:hypothetical protein
MKKGGTVKMADGNKKRTNSSVAAFSTSAGVVAGAAATSGTAVSAAGVGAAGVTGYVTGLVVLAAHLGCESAAAGPILGGVIGYSLYRGVRHIVRRS